MAGLRARFTALLALLRRDMSRRVIALLVLSLGAALLVIEDVQVPGQDLAVGDIADREIRAPVTFQYVDEAATGERRRAAEEAVLPVFDLDASMESKVRARIGLAFDTANSRALALLAEAGGDRGATLSAAQGAEISRDFARVLEVALDPADLERLAAARWDPAIGAAARDLVSVGLRQPVIADRSLLPSPERALSVIRVLNGIQDESRLDSYEQIRDPEAARQAITFYPSDNLDSALSEEGKRLARAVARAAVRPNFSYNQLLSEARKRDAQQEVAEVVQQVQRGRAIIRAGDAVSPAQADMLAQLQKGRADYAPTEGRMAVAALVALAVLSLYIFAASYVERFSTKVTDIETMAFLGLLVLLVSRSLLWMGGAVSAAVGAGLEPTSLWVLAPVAGGGMLVRVLVNAESALIFTAALSGLTGLLMDQQALYTVYFLVVGVTGVGGVSQTRERAQVLRAGLQTGLVGGVAALLMGLVQAHLGHGGDASASLRALWDVGFAVVGGVLSGFMVLALVPVFEQLGYLTDYKLLELANLNHPLLRQLMLRAPGTYHHSIIVSTLSEAAAEAIGGNALLTRVCCYFHDIGKALKPQYFIENQRDAPNRHNRLDPRISARILINHVLDGAAIARQYKLPKPVVDNIYMHHGTGLIQYFYAKALENARPGEEVRQADYRYPGPRPDTREAGIIMLADKAEAACRTIKDPNPNNLREMIQKLVNSTLEDGQLEECPLTLRDLYTIIETFTHTLVGIYHQRIEYPGLPRRSNPTNPGDSNAGPDGRGAVITLEIPSPFARKDGESDSGDSQPLDATGRR